MKLVNATPSAEKKLAIDVTAGAVIFDEWPFADDEVELTTKYFAYIWAGESEIVRLTANSSLDAEEYVVLCRLTNGKLCAATLEAWEHAGGAT